MKQVSAFYNEAAEQEWQRFDRHPIEFAVTQHAMREFLPPAPARVLDCGGGPGRYAIELTRQGYAVTLLDIAANNIALAQVKAQEAGLALAAALTGDARDLSGLTGDFDAVLLMGPLYHLTTWNERQLALTEAVRVLKPGGVLMGTFITRYAPFRDAAAKKPLQVLEETAGWEQLWRDGVNFGGWTEAYFAMPDEVIPFMETAGLTTLALLGQEGICAGHEEQVNQLSGAAWEHWVELNFRFANDPALRAAADHLLYVGKKG